jgi:hypothetical protein
MNVPIAHASPMLDALLKPSHTDSETLTTQRERFSASIYVVVFTNPAYPNDATADAHSRLNWGVVNKLISSTLVVPTISIPVISNVIGDAHALLVHQRVEERGEGGVVHDGAAQVEAARSWCTERVNDSIEALGAETHHAPREVAAASVAERRARPRLRWRRRNRWLDFQQWRRRLVGRRTGGSCC